MYGINSFFIKFFIVLLILYFVLKYIPGEKGNIFRYYFLCICLFLLSAFRGETVGGDLEHYIPHFEEISTTNSFKEIFFLYTSNFEPGYTLLLKFISIISPANRFYLIVTSAISLIGPFIFIKRYSPWPCFSLFIYMLLGFYTNTFNNVRQSMAISIYLISLSFIIEEKNKKFALMCLCASSIHFSAIICLSCLILNNIKLNSRNFFLMLIGGTSFFYICGETIFTNLMVNVLTDKYFGYSGGNGEGYGMLVFYIILTLICYISYILFRDKIHPNSKQYMELFVKFMPMLVAIQLFAPLFASMLRLTYYFYIPIIVLIPSIIKSITDKYFKLFSAVFVFLILLFYSCHFIYSYNPAIDSNSQGVIPYVFSLI